MLRPKSISVTKLSFLAVPILAFCLAGSPSLAEETEEQAAPAEPAQQAEAPSIVYTSAKVVLDGKSETNGVLTLVFQPQGGEAKAIRVNVLAKARAADIGEDLAKEIAFAAGPDYKVKSDGKAVVVKLKNKKVAPFSLVIEEQSLTGVSVRVGKK